MYLGVGPVINDGRASMEISYHVHPGSRRASKIPMYYCWTLRMHSDEIWEVRQIFNGLLGLSKLVVAVVLNCYLASLGRLVAYPPVFNL